MFVFFQSYLEMTKFVESAENRFTSVTVHNNRNDEWISPLQRPISLSSSFFFLHPLRSDLTRGSARTTSHILLQPEKYILMGVVARSIFASMPSSYVAYHTFIQTSLTALFQRCSATLIHSIKYQTNIKIYSPNEDTHSQ